MHLYLHWSLVFVWSLESGARASRARLHTKCVWLLVCTKQLLEAFDAVVVFLPINLKHCPA